MPDLRHRHLPNLMLLSALLLIGGAHAAALDFGAFGPPDAIDDPWPDPLSETLADELDEAAETIRDELRLAPRCRAYFARLGVDLDAWLEPGGPPFVVPRRLGMPFQRSGDPICGAAQAREPFELVFVDPACFRRPQICELASLLLHEFGHLARRDTSDNEPRDFFDACRLSFCIDPERYE